MQNRVKMRPCVGFFCAHGQTLMCSTKLLLSVKACPRFATIRLLTRVDSSDVNQQITAHYKSISTRPANVWFLTTVHSSVPYQATVVCKGSSTFCKGMFFSPPLPYDTARHTCLLAAGVDVPVVPINNCYCVPPLLIFDDYV